MLDIYGADFAGCISDQTKHNSSMGRERIEYIDRCIIYCNLLTLRMAGAVVTSDVVEVRSPARALDVVLILNKLS